jgi:L-galactono-1,4-lactone dehydrogenase
MRELLMEKIAEEGRIGSGSGGKGKGKGKGSLTSAEVGHMGMATLRDHLLEKDALSVAWVKRVNAAEAAAWERSEAFRFGRNLDLLQFDCGGQQWVSEVREHLPSRGRSVNTPDVSSLLPLSPLLVHCSKVCLPAGTVNQPTGSDVAFVEQVLSLIEAEGIPAPSPIEQRWAPRMALALLVHVSSFLSILVHSCSSGGPPTRRAS